MEWISESLKNRYESSIRATWDNFEWWEEKKRSERGKKWVKVLQESLEGSRSEKKLWPAERKHYILRQTAY